LQGFYAWPFSASERLCSAPERNQYGSLTIAWIIPANETPCRRPSGIEDQTMSSYGNEIACPKCGHKHIIRVGEIKAERQVEFTCSACKAPIAIDQSQEEETTEPVAKEDRLKFTLKGVD
jgi:DNA-directed RNA polymerase subunit RPC12/RpoP